jgi:hypothetical protein
LHARNHRQKSFITKTGTYLEENKRDVTKRKGKLLIDRDTGGFSPKDP